MNSTLQRNETDTLCATPITLYLNMLEWYTIALFISKVPTQRNKKSFITHTKMQFKIKSS